MYKENITIMHPKVSGGIITTFEEAVGNSIASFELDNDYYVELDLGIMPRMTYEYIKCTSNIVVLEPVQCTNCKEDIIMSSKAILTQDIKTCPKCFKNIYKKDRRRQVLCKSY